MEKEGLFFIMIKDKAVPKLLLPSEQRTNGNEPNIMSSGINLNIRGCQ